MGQRCQRVVDAVEMVGASDKTTTPRGLPARGPRVREASVHPLDRA